jgi:hypothetical protein
VPHGQTRVGQHVGIVVLEAAVLEGLDRHDRSAQRRVGRAQASFAGHGLQPAQDLFTLGVHAGSSVTLLADKRLVVHLYGGRAQ